MDHMVDGVVLARLIRQHYQTQSAFAESVGVSRQYISLLIKGERTPSLPMVAVFARKLGVTVDDLLGKVMTLARVPA